MGYYTGTNRITSMFSGLDTEAIVKNATSLYRSRVDKAYQSKTALQWRNEAYQSIYARVNEFKNKYFSVLGSNSMMVSSAYNSYKVNTSANNAISISTSGSVINRNLNIYGVRQATSASLTSSKVNIQANLATGSASYSAAVAQGDVAVDGSVAIGTEGKLTVGSDTIEYTADMTYDELVGKLNGLVDKDGKALYSAQIGGDGTVSVKTLTSGKSIILADSEGGTALEGLGLKAGSYTPGVTAATVKGQASGTAFDGENKLTEAISFSVNGQSFNFEVGTAAQDIAKAVNTSNAGVKMTFSEGEFSITRNGTSPTSTVKIAGGGLAALGMAEEEYKPTSTDDTGLKLADLGFNAGAYDFSVNGQSFSFTVDANTTIGDFTAAFNSQAAQNGAGVTMSFDNVTGKFTLANQTGAAMEIKDDSGVFFGGKSLTGIATGKKAAAAINRSDSLSTIMTKLGQAMPEGGRFEFNLKTDAGSVSFAFDGDATLNDITNKINGSGLNVQFAYSEISGTFALINKTTGADTTLEVSGSGFDKLMSGNSVARGQDAQIALSLDGGAVHTITNKSNSFTMDGIKFDITGNYNQSVLQDPDNIDQSTAPAITSSFVYDADAVVTKLKGFISDYNELVDMLSGHLTEKKAKGYDILTEELEGEMTDEQLEKWNEKAKQGLLKNDSNISGLLTNLRTAVYEKVGDTGYSMSMLGITTQSWSATGDIQYGQLEMTEAGEKQLREMLTENPEMVQSVLAQNSNGVQGSFAKLNNILNNYSKTTRTAITDIGEDILENESKYNSLVKRLYEMEEIYWAKMANMETLMSSLTNQTNMFASMLGQTK